MKMNRDAALKYAQDHWNRICDDDTVGTGVNSAYPLKQKKLARKHPPNEDWDVFFVWDGGRSENAVYGQLVNGKLVNPEPDPFLTNAKDDIEDCTHYVSRCLVHGELKIKETPRAHDLITSLMKDKGLTTVLITQTTKLEGQKIIDSGLMKKGDVIGYCKANGNYHHSAMFTGMENSQGEVQGGITCHSVCRYGGLTAAWGTTNDDAWWINPTSGTYTLIHFNGDDDALDVGPLIGWWKRKDGSYCYIAVNGVAKSTKVAPRQETDRPRPHDPVARLHPGPDGVVFIWPKGSGKIDVESWKPGMKTREFVTITVGSTIETATRVF